MKLRAEQQRTAAQAGAAKGNGNGENQKEKKEMICLLLNRISCFELWTVQKEFGQFWVEENVGMEIFYLDQFWELFRISGTFERRY